MTLEELSKGICSVGTMSNIENGLSNIREETLILLANKLNVSINEFFPKKTEEEVRFWDMLEIIKHMLAYDRGADALDKIHDIRQKYKVLLNNSSSLRKQIKYTEALAYKSLGNELSMSSSLEEILDFPAQNQSDILIRSKTYHLLGELYVKRNSFHMAIEKFKAAANELQSYNLDIPWRINYNLCVLYMYQHEYNKSSIYLSLIKQKNTRLIYVKALLKLLTNDYEAGMQLLDVIRLELLDKNDLELLIKVSIASLYFASFSHSHYLDRIDGSKSYMENELLNTKFINEKEIKLMVLKLQFHIATNIHYKNKQSTQYLSILYEFENKYNYHETHHVTLLLDAINTKSLTKDPKKYEDKLMLAKQIMEKKKFSITIIL